MNYQTLIDIIVMTKTSHTEKVHHTFSVWEVLVIKQCVNLR